MFLVRGQATAEVNPGYISVVDVATESAYSGYTGLDVATENASHVDNAF